MLKLLVSNWAKGFFESTVWNLWLPAYHQNTDKYIIGHKKEALECKWNEHNEHNKWNEHNEHKDNNSKWSYIPNHL